MGYLLIHLPYVAVLWVAVNAAALLVVRMWDVSVAAMAGVIVGRRRAADWN